MVDVLVSRPILSEAALHIFHTENHIVTIKQSILHHEKITIKRNTTERFKYAKHRISEVQLKRLLRQLSRSRRDYRTLGQVSPSTPLPLTKRQPTCSATGMPSMVTNGYFASKEHRSTYIRTNSYISVAFRALFRMQKARETFFFLRSAVGNCFFKK